MRFLFLFTILFWLACDTPSGPEPGLEDAFADTFAHFNQDTDELYFQVQLDEAVEVSNVDSVVIVMVTSLSEQMPESFRLFDNGIDGDLLPGNGTFSLIWQAPGPLEYGQYACQARLYMNGEMYNSVQISYFMIEERIPPQILSVDLPPYFQLGDDEITYFNIAVTVEDPNGLDDIKWVRFQINRVLMLLDDPGTPECDRQYGLAGDEYIADASWELIYDEPGDTENSWIFRTSIPMRPNSECGGTGDVLFKFVARDASGAEALSDEWLSAVYACGDGFCTESYQSEILETHENCPEDCP